MLQAPSLSPRMAFDQNNFLGSMSAIGNDQMAENVDGKCASSDK